MGLGFRRFRGPKGCCTVRMMDNGQVKYRGFKLAHNPRDHMLEAPLTQPIANITENKFLENPCLKYRHTHTYLHTYTLTHLLANVLTYFTSHALTSAFTLTCLPTLHVSTLLYFTSLHFTLISVNLPYLTYLN